MAILQLCFILTAISFSFFTNGEIVNLDAPSNFLGGISYANASYPSSTWTKRSNEIEMCNSNYDAYFVMPYMKTSPAKEVTIEFSYRLLFVQHWRLSIGVYILKANSSGSQTPDPNSAKFVHVVDLTNTTLMQINDQITFKAQKTIKVDYTNGLYIAYRSRGTCGIIYPAKATYFVCPRDSKELLEFPLTSAPTTSQAVKRVNGSCVKNAVLKGSDVNNFMLCYTNGTGAFFGECYCKAGYENSVAECKECPVKTFKDTSGNYPCKRCGANVIDGLLPRETICGCIEGFYRPLASKDVYYVNCEEPPSAPRDTKKNVSSTWVYLEWKEPDKIGTGSKPSYELSYGTKNVQTGNLFANLTGLDTFTSYSVRISPVNNVTIATGQTQSATISFTTLPGVPSAVQNLSFTRNDDSSVTVYWKEPQSKGGADLKYFIVVNNDNGRFSKERSLTVKQEKETRRFTVTIRSHSIAGYSDARSISFEIQGKPGIAPSLAIGIGASFAALLLVAIALAILFYRRSHPKHLQPVRLENGEVILPSRSSGARVYVDPTTYQDVEDAVEEFANQLDRKWIEMDQLIGGGEFGDIYKGFLRKPAEEEKIVAIKMLKSNANKKSRDDFLAEAAYMGQFDDPNVISIEGVIVKDRPVLIIIDFMSNGSLDAFLQKNDGKLTSLQMLGMARGVSSGMCYLSEMMFIHRDLAARNILVDANMVCKVADFGMSRELQTEEDTYNTTGGKIPVRWTAPEAIQFKKFTVASDVWSYGILLWEITSYGERPYWDWGNYEVLERLASGYRLPPPMSCPKVVHDLMLSCWHKDRVKRPKFRVIRDTIDKWIRSPALLKVEGSVVTKRDENLDYASMKTLSEWLDSIGLGHYIEKFTDKGLVTPRQILKLDDQDLKEIGITAIGHRNKIIKSINTTKSQLTRTSSLAI